MARSPRLTEYQREQLKHLEPKLRECVKTANLKKAKGIAAKLQKLIRDTHNARWMQNTNWLAECAIEAGEISFAVLRLEGVLQKMNKRTRTYLEATALLAICYLRTNRISDAKFYISKTINNINNIVSDRRRRQFQKRFVLRIEEECIRLGLMSGEKETLDLDEVFNRSVELVQMDDDSLINILGKSVSASSIALLENVRDESIKLIPVADRKLLPTKTQAINDREIGLKTKGAIKHVVWRALCDENDEIYQKWNDKISVVYSKEWIAAAVISAFDSWCVSLALVATVVAMAFKLGAKMFCRKFTPESTMIGLGH